ncbi:MAG: serine protease [Candidatus Zambryskibacteria bacterium]|nr:serine protease [Candidatus Zambryskibacteria bacterium]
MEELNKNQMVLLVLLVSFVTSIGTGIITVSLLMEAPVEVTNTINRVVERTIETVGPVQTIITGGTKETQIKTVVVKEEDQVIGAIEKNIKSVVRIRERNKSVEVDNLYGLGVVVSKEGIIATDKKNISEVMQYVAVMSDGTVIPLVAIFADKKSDIGYFKAKPAEAYTFTPITFAGSDVKLGQSVVVLGGNTTNALSVGRVTLVTIKDPDPVAAKFVSSFTADVGPVDSVYGGPVFSLSGELLGLSISAFSSSKIYIPAAFVKREALLLEAPKNSI